MKRDGDAFLAVFLFDLGALFNTRGGPIVAFDASVYALIALVGIV
jgi:hypothetical protein